MVIVTLSALPGKPYEARGLVSTILHISAGMRTNTLDLARDQLETQAAAMHADAIIDVHMQSHLDPQNNRPAQLIVILLGTAVRFA